MPLAPGTRLGPYEIVAPLGAGGMGEVFRAKDTRLGRDVAVKVLPQHLSANSEVRARFEREAKTVSSLNHPNICTLFDVGREGDTDYLVMELIEGETLAQRLAKGALPIADALRIGAQIADALDRAHRAGVIHRDLKPGNVMLTKSGAKLMDFGLARATGLAGDRGVSGATLSTITQSPTMAAPLTAEGSIVGTFQYMSPEQLEGKEADTRSDLWALGCVLYEMATGRRAFEGATQASLIGTIMRDSPRPMAELAPMSPPALDRLVGALLAKDPDDRVQTAHDVKLQLQWTGDGSSAGSLPTAIAGIAARPRASRERLAWVIAAVGVALGIVGIVVVLRLRPAVPGQGVTRFSIAAPENVNLNSDPTMSAISPDGRTLAFVAADSGGTVRIWVRPLESLTPRPLLGTENGVLPFWSPDSRNLAFFSDNGKLKKIPIAGGNPEEICDAADGRGGSWGSDGVIVFAPKASGPLFRVPASGGDAVQATRLDSSRQETGHRWPCFLPDGKHFLFVGMPARRGSFDFFVGSLDSKGTKHLGSASSAPVFASAGYLIFVHNTSIVAQGFDPRRLASSGSPVTLGEAPPPSGYTGAQTVTASNNGVLAHAGGGLPNTELQWLDRAGQPAGAIPVPAGRYQEARLSPDGKRLCIERRNSASEVDLWLVDLDRATSTRFTFGPTTNYWPAWSPDGSRIAFASNRSGPDDIYVKPTNGAAEETPILTGGALFKDPYSWSADGRFIVFEEPNDRTGWDLRMVPVDGDRKPISYLHTAFNERAGVVSPDGRWIAYTSDESGKQDVYVQSFPAPGSKHQVSTGSAGLRVIWSRGGKELVFVAGDGFTLMAVDVTTSPAFHVSAPRKLFKLRQDYVGIEVTPDGQRVLVVAPAGQGAAPTITIEQNWTAGLKKP